VTEREIKNLCIQVEVRKSKCFSVREAEVFRLSQGK